MSGEESAMTAPEVGDKVKVHLPGEWPWVVVLAAHGPTVIQGRIINDLVAGPNSSLRELHTYKRGDVATFMWRDPPQMPGYYAWELVAPWEQLPFGPREVDLSAPAQSNRDKLAPLTSPVDATRAQERMK